MFEAVRLEAVTLEPVMFKMVELATWPPYPTVTRLPAIVPVVKTFVEMVVAKMEPLISTFDPYILELYVLLKD